MAILSDIMVNVKDYGALGNGVHDDTAAIQSAFDAVVGPWSSPNLKAYGQQSIFFPPGQYVVNPPGGATTMAVTSCVAGASNGVGGNYVRLGFASPHGLTTKDAIYVRNVGGTFEANGPNWANVIDSTHIDLGGYIPGAGGVAPVFTHPYTTGGTVCIPCLRIKGINGIAFYGAGRDTTKIVTSTANCILLHINGARYCDFREMGFSSGTGGISFDLNWDNVVAAGTQGNLFHHCQFANSNSDVGLALGWNGAMCSETNLVSCQVAAKKGIYIGNYNATNNAMFGGQCQACDVGIYANGGDLSCIDGVSFENIPNTYDIQIVNSSYNGYNISNCRSESTSFIFSGVTVPINIIGCSHMGGTGAFFQGSGLVTMIGCFSTNGYIGGNPSLIIRNCNFGLAGFLSTGPNYAYLEQTPPPVRLVSTSTYTIQLADIGTKMTFNSATSQTITVPFYQFMGYSAGWGYNNNSPVTGSKISVQQIGVGQTIFVGGSGVTIRSSNGLKLRAQYSVATLTCDSNDGAGNIVWTLNGDTAP